MKTSDTSTLFSGDADAVAAASSRPSGFASAIAAAWRRHAPRPIRRVVGFYVTGFREMTVGRTLCIVILVKLFVMFAILKLFFFPDLLSRDFDNDADRAAHVRRTLSR